MIDLDGPLPPGALCDAPTEALDQNLAGQTLSWWHGAEDHFTTDPKTRAITLWHPRRGDRIAVPTIPNESHALIGEAGDMTGLQCRDGVHSGLVAENVAAEAAIMTLALRYLPPHGADARTLATFNTRGMGKKVSGENYLFVSEMAGALTIKDDAGLVELTLPAPATDTPRMVIVSLLRDQLAATILGGEIAHALARAPVLSGPGHLFIGCRNQRSGLLKTLGGALIADVWLWPGRALLLSDTPADTAALTALERFKLWSEAVG